MKVKEVPEKIQIHFIKNDYDAWSVRGYSFLEDKQMGMTEYTRTDAFINKAEKWLDEHIFDYVYAKEWGQGVGIEGELFDDFRNAMKGE